MKHTRKILLSVVILIGLQFAWSGCVGYVGGGSGYDSGGVWVHDDVWLDGGGRGWFGHGGEGYSHPGGGFRR